METNFEKQVLDFLAATSTTFKAEFLKHDYYFDGDKDKRDIYKITIQRGQRKISFEFGNSIAHSGRYIGAKHMCLNSYGKYMFNDIKEARYDIQTHGIVKNDKFKEPTAYDVLACLQKYDVGSLSDFCSEFGYDEDSKKAGKVYVAVCKEYDNVCKIWTDDEISQLQEIQ